MTDWRQRVGSAVQRRIVDPVVAQLRQGLSRKRVALSLLIGLLCAFFPVLGLATPLCLLAGVVFRLNHPILQAANLATSPLYLPVVYGLMKLGDRLAGAGDGSLLVMAGHALLGWIVVAPLWVGIGFPAVYALLGCRALSEWSWESPAAWVAARQRQPACSRGGAFGASIPIPSSESRS